MSTIYFDIRPVDAWFFRDGRPYNKGETTQSDVVSLFPPFSPTLVGALRAGLARSQGWSGYGKWKDEIIAVLGDGFEEKDGRLGKLRFEGPFILKDNEPLFPVPLHLLGVKNLEDEEHPWTPITFLSPGEPTLTDIGEVRLPIPRCHKDGLKDAANLYISARGLAALLKGELPDGKEIHSPSKLWNFEDRVGLYRDPLTRTTGDAALYSPRYVRLSKNISLAMGIHGRPEGDTNTDEKAWDVPELFTLGGEARMASSAPLNDFALDKFLPPPSKIPQKGGLTITLLTPTLFLDEHQGKMAAPAAGEAIPDLPGTTVVSACIGKPVFIGGWNSIKREPLPLTPYLPAGTTWFCKIDAAHEAEILQKHLKHIGPRTAYGFGQIALGTWEDSNF